MPTTPWGNFAAQARNWWDGASPATRIGAGGFAVAVVIAFVMAAMMATAPNYEPMFSNLSPDDAAAIAAKLDDEHVKYQLADNDTTVLVPAADKDRLRLDMVRAGLPAKTGSVLGTEWLDKIGMSTTADVQDQYINLANEGELSRTIQTISAVGSASVHISPGDNTPFAVQSSATTASAVIGLKPGASLSQDQVMGIAALIAKSVPNLDIKNVAVIDTDGNQLWTGGDDPNGPGGSASNKIAAQEAVSETMRKQWQSYLDMVLGPRKSIVSVNAELNYNQVKSSQTLYGKGAPVSEQETDEKYTGAGDVANGQVAGAAANTPGGVAAGYPNASTTGGKTGNYQSGNSSTNYDPSVTQTDTQQAQGAIEHLAVGVLIDSSIPVATVSAIQSYLSTLAGVTAGSSSRAVTVVSVPFSNVAAMQQMAELQSTSGALKQAEMIKIGSVIAVLLVLMFIFLKSSGAASNRALAGVGDGGGPQELGSTYEPREFLIGGHSDSHGDPMLAEGPVRLEDVLDDMPEPVRKPKRRTLIPEIEEHSDIKLESIKEMIHNQPQSVALLMKGWMSEEVGI